MDIPKSSGAFDLAAAFAALPGAIAVIAADPPRFTVLAASDTLLATTGRSRDAVVGRPLAEAFPNASPDDPAATGLADLRASLQAAIRTRTPQPMERQRYDLPRPDGTWETRYWDVINIPVHGPDGAVRCVLHQTAEVTGQVRADAALARATAHDAYRVALTDALHGAEDPVEAQAAAIRALGASRVLFGEADPGSAGTFTNRCEFRRDPAMPTSLGTYRWDDFGAHVATELRAGRTLVVDDVRAHAPHSAEDLLGYATVGIRAYLAVPIVRKGRIVGYLAASHTVPHAWTADEVALAEETAGRTWAAVERARAEAALSVSQTKYAALFAASPAPFLILAPDSPRFTITDVNDAYLAATMRTRDEVVGRGLFEAFPDNPEDTTIIGARTLRASLERVLATHQPDALPRLRYDIARPDGTFEERWWSPVNSAALDENGEVEVIIHNVSDVTEQHRAETARRESEERLRRVLDGMGEGFGLLAPDFTILEQNREALRMDGRAREEIVGRSHWDAYPGSETSELGALLQKAMAERVPVSLEHQYAWAAGRGLWLEMRAYPTSDGSLAVFWRDVTARREADNALRASEVRYRTLVNKVLDYAIFLLDSEGRVTEWTPGAERVKGYTADEAVGCHVSLFYPPEAVASGELEREMTEAARSGRAEREGWRVRKDGTRFWVNEIMTAVHDGGGNVVSFTKISRDLTEQRMAAEAIERARAEAEREVLRRELSGAEEAERRRIARELHDQLGQHLTAFALGLGEARRRLAAGQAAEAQLTQLEELSRAMTRDARYLALQLRPPELDDVGLESALRTYVEQWSARLGVAAEVAVTGMEAERAIPEAAGTAIYRIVQEALTNVAKHANATHVSVMLDRPAGEARLIVEDDGQGFDAAAADKRARRERRLGLASMRERAALVGGTLEIETSPGGGTAVYVRVPVSAD